MKLRYLFCGVTATFGSAILFSASACPYHDLDPRAAIYYHYYGTLPPGYEERADGTLGPDGAIHQPRAMPSFAKRNYFTPPQLQNPAKQTGKFDVQTSPPLNPESDLPGVSKLD